MSSQGKDPRHLLASTISDLHKSGAYSDFKIVCGSDTYNVHKNIICPQSEFFRAACRPDTFQEGKTRVVTLPSNPGRDMDALQAAIKANEFDWDSDVEDTTAVKLMIHYFYHHDYPSYLPTHAGHADLTADNVAKCVLAVHSKMYAMGDKYQIPGLKALAARNFRPCWLKTFAGLNTAIVIAFMSTPETDQALRMEIVDELGKHMCIAKNDVVDKTIKELPELVYALYRNILTKTA
jgi:hypothetical protein